MPFECPKCKSPVAREGQRFCYRCGHELNAYYDSLQIKVADLQPSGVSKPGEISGAVFEVQAFKGMKNAE